MVLGIVECAGVMECPPALPSLPAVQDAAGNAVVDTGVDAGVSADAEVGVMTMDGGPDADVPDADVPDADAPDVDASEVDTGDVEGGPPVDVPRDSPAMTFQFVGGSLVGGTAPGPQVNLQINWTGTLRGTAMGPSGPISFEGTIR